MSLPSRPAPRLGVPPPGLPGFVFEITVLTFAVALLSQAGWWFVNASPGVVSPVWPASGLALAAALVRGLDRVVPAVYIGSLASNLLSGDPPIFSYVAPLAQVLEVVIGTYLVRDVAKVDLKMPAARDFVKFVAAGCSLGPAVAAVVTAWARTTGSRLPGTQMAGGIGELWQAHAFGALVFGTFFLFVFLRQDFRPVSSAGRYGLLACSVGLWTLLALLLTSGGNSGLAFFLLGAASLLSLVVAVFFGLRSTALFLAMFVFLVPACVVIFPIQARTAQILQNAQGPQFLLNGLAFVSSLGCLLLAAFRDELNSTRIKFGLALEAASVCLWEWTPDAWRCRTPSWTARLGLPEDREIPDAEWRALVHPEDRADFDASLARLGQPGSPKWSHVYRMHDGPGNWIWVHSYAQPVQRTVDDAPAVVAGVTRDITDERLAMQTRIAAIESEAELRTLRSQLNPHFLFNALNSVRALIGRHDAKAREMITSLGSLLRGLLSNRDGRMHPVERELQLVHDYLDVELIRFGDRLRQRIECSVEAAACMIPGMVVLTLVENAIKHGVSKLDSGGLIEVLIRCEPGWLVIEVISDGPLGVESGGFGLANCRRRIALSTDDLGSLELREVEGPRVVATVRLPRAKGGAGV